MKEGEQYGFKLDDGKAFSGVMHRGEMKMHSIADQPAVVYEDGTAWWYKHNKIHRDGGPAVVWHNGVEEWFQDGVRHRLPGPAVTYPDSPAIMPQLRGVKQYWHFGHLIREETP